MESSDQKQRPFEEILKMPRAQLIAEYGGAVTDKDSLAAISKSSLNSAALLQLFGTIEKAKGQPQKLRFVFKFLREKKFGEVEAIIVSSENFEQNAHVPFQDFLKLYMAFNYLEKPSFSLAGFYYNAIDFLELMPLFLKSLFALSRKRFGTEILYEFTSIYFPSIGYMPRDLKEKCLLALISSAKKSASLFDIIHSINKVILKGRYQTVLENIVESEHVLNTARNFISELEKTTLSGKEFLCAIVGSVPLRMTHSASDADLVIMVIGVPYDASIVHGIYNVLYALKSKGSAKIDIHISFFPNAANLKAEDFSDRATEKKAEDGILRFVVPYEVLKGDPKKIKKIFDTAAEIYKNQTDKLPVLFWKGKYVGRTARDKLIVTKPKA